MLRKRVGEIDRAASGRSAGNLVALKLREVVVSVQVVKRPVLAEAFVEVAALDGVDEWPAVGGVVGFAVRVEGDAKAIGAAFAEEFEFASDRVVTPQTLLKFEAAYATGRGAAVHAIEPAVGAPGEMVGHRLAVFHAEAREQNFGIAIGNI